MTKSSEQPVRNVRRIPDFAKTTSLVARALGMSPEQLLASFRPAAERDLPRVSALRQAEFGSRPSGDIKYLSWRYRFGRKDSGSGECWLLEREAEVLAVLGTEDVVLQGTGGPCKITFLMDILVREDLRGIAIGPWMNMALMECHECVAAIGSNKNSSGMVMALFNQLRWLRTYTFYLRCDYIVQRNVTMPMLAGAIAGVGNLALHVWRTLHRRRDPALRISEVQDLESLGPAFGHWRYPPEEIGRTRDDRFLTWRVLQHPKHRYRVLGAWRGTELVAYLIVHDATVYGQRAVRMVDWLCAPGEESAVRSLSSVVIAEAARSGCSLVTVCLLHERTEASLRALGFSLRSAEDVSFVYNCRPSHPLHGVDLRWYITALDSDTS